MRVPAVVAATVVGGDWEAPPAVAAVSHMNCSVLVHVLSIHFPSV